LDERLFVSSVVHLAIHSGLDRAGQDRIDANAPWSKLGSKRLGQADQAGFTCGIGRDTWKCETVADEGRGEDHRPTAMLQHFGDLMLRAEASRRARWASALASISVLNRPLANCWRTAASSA
jgi:hypothetical protein